MDLKHKIRLVRFSHMGQIFNLGSQEKKQVNQKEMAIIDSLEYCLLDNNLLTDEWSCVGVTPIFEGTL